MSPVTSVLLIATTLVLSSSVHAVVPVRAPAACTTPYKSALVLNQPIATPNNYDSNQAQFAYSPSLCTGFAMDYTGQAATVSLSTGTVTPASFVAPGTVHTVDGQESFELTSDMTSVFGLYKVYQSKTYTLFLYNMSSGKTTQVSFFNDDNRVSLNQLTSGNFLLCSDSSCTVFNSTLGNITNSVGFSNGQSSTIVTFPGTGGVDAFYNGYSVTYITYQGGLVSSVSVTDLPDTLMNPVTSYSFPNTLTPLTNANGETFFGLWTLIDCDINGELQDCLYYNFTKATDPSEYSGGEVVLNSTFDSDNIVTMPTADGSMVYFLCISTVISEASSVQNIEMFAVGADVSGSASPTVTSLSFPCGNASGAQPSFASNADGTTSAVICFYPVNNPTSNSVYADVYELDATYSKIVNSYTYVSFAADSYMANIMYTGASFYFGSGSFGVQWSNSGYGSNVFYSIVSPSTTGPSSSGFKLVAQH